VSRSRLASFVTGLSIVIVLGGCVSGPAPSDPAETSAVASTEPLPWSSVPSLAPSVVPAPSSLLPSPPIASAAPSSAAVSTCVDRTLAALTEAQRIGQLFAVGLANDRLDATSRQLIIANHFGSVWYRETTTIGVAGVRRVADAAQALATEAVTGRVRFFVAANQEGGRIQALAGSGFGTIPSAVDQGAMLPATLETRATAWGTQLAAAGVNLDFAPVADVVPAGTERGNAPIGQLQREFGSDPGGVGSRVAAFVRGMRAAGVATTAKHFPGLGRVAGNTDFTGAVIDTVTTPADPYLAPFKRAISVHVPFVMVSLATYDRIDADHLAAFSPTVIETVLRGELGFRGVVMSDSLTATAVADIDPGQRAIDFIAAGGDMIVLGPIDVAVPMVAALAQRAAADAVFRARIDESARRILTAKDASGLLPCSG
jgi:beta-N-acetylhexosaminidase